jgi:ABC-type lipoprotein export system ATPase subunit
MSSELVLPSLEIRRFRAFRKLEIGRLGRVNLIVGKNNVGKSTLLEALRLFARPASFTDLIEIFATRNEIAANLDFSRGEYDVEDLPFGRLFFGRLVTITDSFTIGPADSPQETLTVCLMYRNNLQDNVDQKFIDIHRDAIAKFDRSIAFMFDSEVQFLTSSRPLLYKIHRESTTVGNEVVRFEPIAGTLRTIPFHSVGPNGLSLDDIDNLWNDVSLSPREQEVITTMRIISPEVERVAMRSPDVCPRDVQYHRDTASRVPFAKIESLTAAIPLRELGDGVSRLFGIALALSHAKDGILLVDEIENGLHYSIHEKLWKLVFKTARDMNVQVFATTHSWDCIEAFQRAACEDTSSEGYLIRLGWRRDDIVATVYDENDLAIVTRDHIEVR